MKDPDPPAGFGTWWEDTALFVRLPEVVRTTAHVLEPVLSGADARALAAIATERQGAPAERVVLAGTADYAPASIAAFRERLLSLLEQRGARVRVELEGEAPPPRPPPFSMDPGGDTDATPIPPPTAAPVPTRRRPGTRGDAGSPDRRTRSV